MQSHARGMEGGALRPRELSLRALVAGAGIGALLAAANLLLGLKTGFWDSGSITAALLGFALFQALGRRTFSPLENNVTQTTAAAVAAMPSAAGLLGALPALGLLGRTVPAWA